MHNPIAALAWEFWRRHRRRITLIVGLFLGFALVYPRLCALADFNPASNNALDEIGRTIASSNEDGASPLRVVYYFLFLAAGPKLAMILTLLCVTWMFTFTEFDLNTKEAMKFPVRLFTLPVSTSFLFWHLFLGGMAAIIFLYESWVYLVPLPRISGSDEYQNCFVWMTLLALIQGIVWGLASWPKTRALLCIATIFVFVVFILSPAQQAMSELPYLARLILLLPIFLLGLALGRAGLQKMRHGQWQGWTWKWRWAARTARAELRGSKRFVSPAQAQLWFEWRRFARPACFYVAGLVVIPISIYLLWGIMDRFGNLDDDVEFAFVGCLVAVPLLIHFCFGGSLPGPDLYFVTMRPITNGEMTMATLKAAGISTLFSWIMVLVVWCAVPWLGTRLEDPYLRALFYCRSVIVLGLICLTWRLVAVNLCFVLSGKRWMASFPSLPVVAVCLGGLVALNVTKDAGHWDVIRRLIPGLLASLVALKFLLAFLAFRVSLKRGLLAPSAMRAYLIVWTLMAAALLIPTLILFHGQPWILPLALVIVLLIPLARIGFCPIALDWNRHA